MTHFKQQYLYSVIKCYRREFDSNKKHFTFIREQPKLYAFNSKKKTESSSFFFLIFFFPYNVTTKKKFYYTIQSKTRNSVCLTY